jgi:hypothetical protein
VRGLAPQRFPEPRLARDPGARQWRVRVEPFRCVRVLALGGSGKANGRALVRNWHPFPCQVPVRAGGTVPLRDGAACSPGACRAKLLS